LKKVQGKKQRESEASEAGRKAIMEAVYDDQDKENASTGKKPEEIPLPEPENILGDQDDEDIIF